MMIYLNINKVKIIMKKNLFFIPVLSIMLAGCVPTYLDKTPEGYDYVIGNDYSDLVKITIKYANDKYHNGEVYKTWGVKRGTAPGVEPKYPDINYIFAFYGFNTNLKPRDDSSLIIDFKNYKFNLDTTIYVKYYGRLQPTKWCIPNGPTNKGSGMMFSQSMFFENTEIERMPTLENQTVGNDWGDNKLKESLNPWVTQWGWTKIDAWYYDEELSQPVVLPFYYESVTQFWAECS